MKQALLDFYLRTAYNNEAIEFLQKFNSVEPERFALIVPENEVWKLKRELFMEDLAYLLKLGLSPTLFLSPAFFSAAEIREIKEACAGTGPQAEGARILISPHAGGMDLIGGLGKAASEGKFFKYIFVLDNALEDSGGRRPNRVFLRAGGVQWGAAAGRVMEWMEPFVRLIGPSHAAQVVRPEDLLPELFTESGCGTMISLGYDFCWLDSGGVDKGLLSGLIEQGFGRRLAPGYFESLGSGWRAMIERDYIAAIVLMPMGGMNYMDKFVVAPQYLGRGVGSLLIEELLLKLGEVAGERPSLIWRTRHDNPFLGRYAALLHQAALRNPLSCGSVHDERYVYHFLGVDRENQGRAVDMMRHKPGSFLD